ncbi:MAG: 2-C-methyl-D-erythritol 4-phosphate cytidylyltransferase [Lachnospiraceae bacterium]|nr:2-C-methyl-D-erythritol 4-phosphate cytidylyltransferase [Lachnospiraceae bacterium]
MEEKNVAIVLAAGQGRRMGADRPKQFLEIREKPILYYALHVFQESPLIQEIILVTGEEMIGYCQKEIVERFNLDKVKHIVCGGAERYLSVCEGLKCCSDSTYVFIHDGARPFISEAMLERALEAARQYQACVVGMPSKDTIKIADVRGFIAKTPSRERVWNIQTPQVFSSKLIRRAYGKLMQSDVTGITDDAMVVEHMTSRKIRLVEGSYENIKITTPEDLVVAEAFLESLDIEGEGTP